MRPSPVLAAAVLLAAAGCGGDDVAPTRADDDPSSPASRCSTPVGGESHVLEPADGVRLPAAVYGAPADTAMVLLHQTNGDGLCGWDVFARAAAERGVASLAYDMCGWGASECPDAWSERTAEQVGYAVDYARDELGASRVVVVGASMGGARAVLAVADGVDAEAWVDLSGAPAWDGRVVADEARRVKIPGLVVHDPDDGAAEYAASRVTARRAGATFVEGSEGHGYDMVFDPGGPLTALGERVLAFVEG